MSREDLPKFLRALSTYDGEARTRSGLRLAVLTFVRTTELRAARWDEVDLEAAEWRIPAERMKMRALHIVPVSRQAVETAEKTEQTVDSLAELWEMDRDQAVALAQRLVEIGFFELRGSKDAQTF